MEGYRNDQGTRSERVNLGEACAEDGGDAPPPPELEGMHGGCQRVETLGRRQVQSKRPGGVEGQGDPDAVSAVCRGSSRTSAAWAEWKRWRTDVAEAGVAEGRG